MSPHCCQCIIPLFSSKLASAVSVRIRTIAPSRATITSSHPLSRLCYLRPSACLPFNSIKVVKKSRIYSTPSRVPPGDQAAIATSSRYSTPSHSGVILMAVSVAPRSTKFGATSFHTGWAGPQFDLASIPRHSRASRFSCNPAPCFP